jgi:hypothetical protein
MSFAERKQILLSVLEQTKTLRLCGATSYYSDGTYNASYNNGNLWIEVVYNNIKNRDIAMLQELKIIEELESMEDDIERKTELIKVLELIREYEKICAINFCSCYPHYKNYDGESINVDVTYAVNKTRVDELCSILNLKQMV